MFICVSCMCVHTNVYFPARQFYPFVRFLEGFQTSDLKKKKKSRITALADINKEWNEVLASIAPQHCSSILGDHPVERLTDNSFPECPRVLHPHSQQTWVSQTCPTKHLAALLPQVQLLKS